VDSLFCPVADVEAAASASLQEELRDAGQPPIEIERPAPNVMMVRSPTRRIAYVATSLDLIYVRMAAPSGPTAEDDANFAAMIATAREPAGPNQRLRRANWLVRQARWRPAPISACGMQPSEMLARGLSELRIAAQEDPHAWEPWALLGEEADMRAGGLEVLDVALTGEQVPLPRRTREAMEPRPLDPDALREAARYYAEAVRRDPPRPSFGPSSRVPLDRSTILSRLARAHALLGDQAAAEAAWRDAIDEEARDSWGYLESAFMLAERELARGNLVEARRLYDLARRAYWTYHRSDLVQPSPGRLLIARIEERRRELRDRCRLLGPILSTSRPGCARGDTD
jgi:tetratricopeptide (TPR) repeat protein